MGPVRHVFLIFTTFSCICFVGTAVRELATSIFKELDERASLFVEPFPGFCDQMVAGKEAACSQTFEVGGKKGLGTDFCSKECYCMYFAANKDGCSTPFQHDGQQTTGNEFCPHECGVMDSAVDAEENIAEVKELDEKETHANKIVTSVEPFPGFCDSLVAGKEAACSKTFDVAGKRGTGKDFCAFACFCVDFVKDKDRCSAPFQHDGQETTGNEFCPHECGVVEEDVAEVNEMAQQTCTAMVHSGIDCDKVVVLKGRSKRLAEWCRETCDNLK